MQFISWVEMQGLMTWWHDDMMQCKNKSHGETRNSWKASGASVSGCYNTPPLQEDLVPRSRIASERSGRGRGETKLLLDKQVKPLNLERSQSLKKWHDGGEQNLKHSIQQEEQGTLQEPCRLKDKQKWLWWTRSTCKHSGWNEMYKER